LFQAWPYCDLVAAIFVPCCLRDYRAGLAPLETAGKLSLLMRRQLGMVIMLSDATIARPCALQRIPKIANELAVAHPKAPDLVQELFALAMDLALEERRPQPIETAPDQTGLVLLLFCPRQGGWHTGEWFQGEWTDTLTRGKSLEPTHWMDVPPEPDGPEDPRGFQDSHEG
jgi:hypothetical protein